MFLIKENACIGGSNTYCSAILKGNPQENPHAPQTNTTTQFWESPLHHPGYDTQMRISQQRNFRKLSTVWKATDRRTEVVTLLQDKKGFYTHLEACMRLSSLDKKRFKTPLTWKILVTWVPSSARNGIFIARGSPSLLRFFPHPRLSATARPGPHGRTGIVRPFLHSAAFKKGFSFFNRDKILLKKAKTWKFHRKNSTLNVH